MVAAKQHDTIAVVYETMFGSTQQVAEAIARGLSAAGAGAVILTPVSATERLPKHLTATIIGAPTHVHGLSRPSTRAEAAQWATDDARHLRLDDTGMDFGVREWLASGVPETDFFAAFDTRVDMPRMFTGSAAAAIDHRFAEAGIHQLCPPTSFLVDRSSTLQTGELHRAEQWGSRLFIHLGHAQEHVRQARRSRHAVDAHTA